MNWLPIVDRVWMNADDVVLAIDMGSTWCKVAWVDRDGRLLAEGRSYSRGGPPFGHSADDLAHAWTVLVEAVRDADAGVGPPAAIAISCRKAPGVWFDRDGQPVSPPREAVVSAGRFAIEESYSAGEVWEPDDPFAFGYGLDLIGNTRWLRRTFPDLWERVARAGTLHNWLVYRLTGRWVTSPAAGPARFRWPEAAAELTGLEIGAFPEVVESYREVAPLTAEAAGALGLPAGTPVVAGTHDGAAANLGAGAMHPGDTCLTLGTNGVIRVVTGEPVPRQFGYPIVEGRWAMVRDIVGIAPHLDDVVAAIDEAGKPVSAERHARLTALARDVPAGSNGVRLPVPELGYLSPDGVNSLAEVGDHPVGVVYRAALEGVALAFRGVVEVVRQAGAMPDHYAVTGGATANRLLLRMMSGVLDAPVHITPGETGVRGAAILAAAGAGWFPSLDSAVAHMVPAGEEILATPEERATYRDLVASVELPRGVAPGDMVRGG